MHSTILPMIIIIGRQNVGKSTLFNKLTHTQNALVANCPGLTQDYQYGYVKWSKYEFIIIDTGGIQFSIKTNEICITNQCFKIIQESNIILFMVDNQSGIVNDDKNIAKYLIKLNKRVIIVANKTDGISNIEKNFYSLGLGNAIYIAAYYGRGINNLLKIIALSSITINVNTLNTSKLENIILTILSKNNTLLNEKTSITILKSIPIKIAIIGRPNVGKSTLTNYLLADERMLVLDTPGTTRDSIYTIMKYDNKEYVLIDTAGIRKKNKVTETIEKFFLKKTLEAVENSNVILFIIDVHENISKHNLSLLNFFMKSGKSMVIAINKCDSLSQEELNKIKDKLTRKLIFIKYVKIHFISALYGTKINDLLNSINESYQNSIKKIKTTVINKLMRIAIDEHKTPMLHGRRKIKLKYAHIGNYAPLTIIIHGTNVESLPNTYKRYLTNYFYRSLSINGAPIYLQFNNNINPYC